MTTSHSTAPDHDPRSRHDLERAAAGDGEAVRRAVERFGPWVNGLVRAHRGDRPDLVAAIFERLWRDCARYDPRAESELVFVARLARRELLRTDSSGDSPPTRPKTSAKAESAPVDRLERRAAAPCDESRKLTSLLAGLGPEQMQRLRTALYEGRDPSIETGDGTDRTVRRAELRDLLERARRTLDGVGRRSEVSK